MSKWINDAAILELLGRLKKNNPKDYDILLEIEIKLFPRKARS